MPQSERITTTAGRPFVIANPLLAFVNLTGDTGKALMEADRDALSQVFRGNVEIADKKLPRCNVLFLYCSFEDSGRIAGHSYSFRDLVKGAGAHIAVIATDVSPALLSNPDFDKRNGWPANLVITLNRNGEHFAPFFQKLFSQMWDGTSMPMAWVELAPQGPVQPDDIPGAIFIPEAGHVAFRSKKG